MNSRNDLFEVSSTYWLIVFALSICVTIGYAWRLAFGSSSRWALWPRIKAIAAGLLLCLVAVDGLHFAQQIPSAHWRIAATVSVIAATAALTWLHLMHWNTPSHVFRRRASAWLLLFSLVSMSAWSSHRFYQRLDPPPKRPPLLLRTPGGKREVHEFVALTDRNHPIRVYRMDEDDSVLEELDPDTAISVDYSDAIIQRAAASPLSNCHGWVFLDGEYLISGEAVQRILDDNGYELTTDPKAGDIIIYRAENRDILHSGLVRGVLNDGTVIIESKWGTEGCFLHEPEGQPYSTLFEYYRSPRGDHRVRIVPVDELPVDQ